MYIYKFMTKEVTTIDREADITEARKLMTLHRFRHLPVTRFDKTLIGLISDRDIRSAMPSKYFHDHRIKEIEADGPVGVLVQDVMTKDPVCISSSVTIQDVLLLIEKTRVGAFSGGG